MKKPVLLFTDAPPEDKTALHVWIGKATLSHQEHLQQILRKYLKGAPLKLESNAAGKPFLPGIPLYFNLSDAEDWLAIVLSWEAPVGIDIEIVRPIEGMDQLITDCFAPREQAYVNASGKGRDLRFWQIWNRKEACFKALGLGLQDRMKEWDCFGDDWIHVNKVWVRSIPVKSPLSTAVAICG